MMLKTPFNGARVRAFLNALTARPLILLTAVLFALMFTPQAAAADKTGWLFSPGELSEKHAKYEGMGNCTLCHTVGSGVTDAKCLDCHDKLA